MRKFLLLLICFFSSQLSAGLYIRGSGGFNIIETEEVSDAEFGIDTGYYFSAALGYRLFDYWRIEVEGATRRNDAHAHGIFVPTGEEFTVEMDINKWTALANGYVDIPVRGGFYLYGGGGASAYFAEGNVAVQGSNGFGTGRFRDNGFAWQAIGGLGYWFPNRVDLTVDYKYLTGPNLDINHTVALNVMYNF